MHEYCSRCGLLGGTPDDHPCLKTLKQKFDGLKRSITDRANLPPGGSVDFHDDSFTLESLQVAQKELFELHEKMVAVERWHLDAVTEQGRRASIVGQEINDVATWVNAARSALRERLEDL